MDVAEKVLVARKNIATLEKFIKEYNVLPEKVSKDPRLDAEIKLWAGTQMRYISTGAISDEEVDVYREYNFDFGIKPLKWSEWFLIVKQYCNERATDRIPSGTLTEEGYDLGKWLKRQYANRKYLSDERFEKIKLIKRDLKRGSRKSFTIEYKGQIFTSATAFSKEVGIRPEIVFEGARQGMNGKEIIEYYKRRKEEKYQGRQIYCDGIIFDNTREFADYYDIRYEDAQRFFYEGYDPETVIEYSKNGKPKKPRKSGFKREEPVHGRQIICGGKEYISIKQFAEENKLDYSKTIYYLGLGFLPEVVIQIVRDDSDQFYTGFIFDNKYFKSKKEFAFYYKIPYVELMKQLSEGNSLEQILELHKKGLIRKPKLTNIIVYEGHVFENAKVFAKHYGLNYQYVYVRLKSGWTYDEIVHPDKYDLRKRIEYKPKSKNVNEENLSKWEESYEETDILRAAKAYYYGRGVDKDYGKAFNLLNEIEYIEAAKFLLASCYLYGKGTDVDAKKAVRLLEEYNSEADKDTHAVDKETGVLKRVLPLLFRAYKTLLYTIKDSVFAQERLEHYAIRFNNNEAQVILYMYFTDINNMYYDCVEAIKYLEMINDFSTIYSIHEKNPNCVLSLSLIEISAFEAECARNIFRRMVGDEIWYSIEHPLL